MDIYRAKRPSAGAPLDKSNPAAGATLSDSAEQESSRIRKLEKLIKKRL